jgi:hypothetical protein
MGITLFFRGLNAKHPYLLFNLQTHLSGSFILKNNLVGSLLFPVVDGCSERVRPGASGRRGGRPDQCTRDDASRGASGWAQNSAAAVLRRGEQRQRARHGNAGARGEGGVGSPGDVPRSSDDHDMWIFPCGATRHAGLVGSVDTWWVENSIHSPNYLMGGSGVRGKAGPI